MFKTVTFLDADYMEGDDVIRNLCEWDKADNVLKFCLVDTLVKAQAIQQYAEEYHEILKELKR